MTTKQGTVNEAAERLPFTNEYVTVMEIVTRYGGEQVIAGPPMDRMVNELTEAMLAERKATVELIRAAIDAAPLTRGDDYCNDFLSEETLAAILDAEAER